MMKFVNDRTRRAAALALLLAATAFSFAQDRGDRDRRPDPARKLPAAEANEDLGRLERKLRDEYAYLELRKTDWERRLADLRKRCEPEIATGELAIGIQCLLAVFGDGHSRVRQISNMVPPRFAPFAFTGWRDRVLALTSEGRPIDAELPVLRAIDGQPLERWLKAAETLAADGSPQFRRARAIENLAYTGWLRRELSLPDPDQVEVEIASLDGARAKTIREAVARRPARPFTVRFGKTRTLDDDIGYLRIESMDDQPAFLANLRASMDKFRTSRGLIIDVRGNGGGSRAALRTLAPYFLPPDSPPYVANVAAYRVPPNEPRDKPDGYLENRWLYPATWKDWSPAAKKEIERVAASFKPEWTPPPERFSAWHYFVLERPADADAPYYDRPVAVLMDGDCFSATDIFLGALKGRRNIALMGNPSGGGSGRAIPLRLRTSNIELLLSSMASFRPDGRLYDAQGIDPDLRIEPTLQDALGESDSTLEAAQAHIRKRSVPR